MKHLLLTVIAFTPFSSSAQVASKNVLIVHFGWEKMPLNQIASQTIEQNLTSDSALNVQIFREYLDDLRMEVDQVYLAESIQRKYYPSHRPDVIISVGTSAANLFVKYGASHFAGVPVVFLMVDERFLPMAALPPAMTGVSFQFDFAGTVRLALRLSPDTKNVFFVTGVSPAERLYEEIFKQEAGPLLAGRKVTYLDNLSLGELLSYLSQLPPQSIVVYSVFFFDRTSTAYVSGKLAAPIAASSTAPVYGLSPTYMGSGIVGGSLFDVEAEAGIAAAMARRILHGEKPGAIPRVAGRSRPVLDWQQLERWHIDKTRVPKDARILNKESSAWQRYKRVIAGSAAIFAGMLILIGWLMREIRRRKQSESALQTLSSHLITAQEQERARIARDLHDGVGQQVATLSLASHLLAEEIPSGNTAVRAKLSKQQEQFSELAREIREISHNLHPSILRTCGLHQALQEYCIEFEKLHDIAVGLSCTSAVDLISPQAALCLFRVTQEALQNVAKHAATDLVEISLVQEKQACVLTIRDYGCGFDRTAVYRGNGLGLISMEERLRALQGTLSIFTKKGRGTTIVVRVPFQNGEQLMERAAAAGQA